ncbi:MAG: NlpC/P60 family protein [Selenomonas sp.]|nr:NlpC/P60 family protein [Selenomonas sp.]
MKQAFRFLGDEYGWGGQNNSVDCSSFTQNVYRSFGIMIPARCRPAGAGPACECPAQWQDTAERYALVRQGCSGLAAVQAGPCHDAARRG